MKTFKVRGVLFGVTNDGLLHVFVPNFDSVYGLNGLSGFWETIGNIGSSIATGAGKVYDTVSNAAKSILTPDNINAATSIAAGIIGYKTAQVQAKLSAQQAIGMPQGGEQLPPGIPSSGTPAISGSGWNVRPDTTTLLLIGGAAIILILALRK